MSSNRVTASKFTTSSSRSRARRARIQDESGNRGGVKPPLLQKEAGTESTGFFLRINPVLMLLVLLLFVFPFPAKAEDFMGFPCTKDCSGHKAGYALAEKHNITNPDECGGKSNSFVEGCRARALEQQGDDAAPKDDDSNNGDNGE